MKPSANSWKDKGNQSIAFPLEAGGIYCLSNSDDRYVSIYETDWNEGWRGLGGGEAPLGNSRFSALPGP